MARTRSEAGRQLPAFEDPGQQPVEATEEEREGGEQAQEKPAANQTTTEAAAEEGRIPNLLDLDEFEPSFPIVEVGGLPDWARQPDDLMLPSGLEIGCFRFKANLTNAAHKGDRCCIAWPLTDRDERVALVRAAHNPLMAQSELAKQMIRAFDGRKADWGAAPGRPGCVDDFWNEIGSKCRQVLKRFHAKTHSMQPDELAYFFEHCVALRVVG